MILLHLLESVQEAGFTIVDFGRPAADIFYLDQYLPVVTNAGSNPVQREMIRRAWGPQTRSIVNGRLLSRLPLTGSPHILTRGGPLLVPCGTRWVVELGAACLAAGG